MSGFTLRCVEAPEDCLRLRKEIHTDGPRMLITAHEGDVNASVYVDRDRARVLAAAFLAFATGEMEH